jgi:serine/threonine protein kinase
VLFEIINIIMTFSLKMVLAFFLHIMEQIWQLFRSNTDKADLARTDMPLKDKIQINKKLCKRLEKKLVKIRKLAGSYGKPSEISDMQKKVLHELDVVMKRAEDLLQQCMCKGMKSWLYYAVTLTDIKEDVLEIELDLVWWTSILGMSTTYHVETTLDFEENDVMKALALLKTCYYKLSNERESLQMTAAEDNEHLQSKLEDERKKHGKGTEQYLLIVYLLSRLKDSKGGFDIPDGDIKFLDEHFYNNLKSTKILGRGSFGEVHEVTWLWQYLKFRKWAVKMIFNADERRPEGKFLQFCNHPHIVRFIWSWKQEHFGNPMKDEDVEESEKLPHILMECMPTDLSTFIAQRVKKNEGGPPFEEHVAIDMMLQIAKAVRYLHGKKINIDGTKSKITHRDLKPKNVLVEPCGTRCILKLTDFGISKVYHGTETRATQTANRGTNVYAAPEVWLPEKESSKFQFPPKADVWSFAMTCSEILTGEPPFTGYPLSGLHLRIKEQGIRPTLPSNLPDHVRFCITSCWNLNPQQRPIFLNICRMLNLAKAMSLGILPLDVHTRSLLQPDHPMWQIPHSGTILNTNAKI